MGYENGNGNSERAPRRWIMGKVIRGNFGAFVSSQLTDKLSGFDLNELIELLGTSYVKLRVSKPRLRDGETEEDIQDKRIITFEACDPKFCAKIDYKRDRRESTGNNSSRGARPQVNI